MKTSFLAFVGAFLMTTNFCSAQTKGWSNGTDWTLYDLKGAKFYRLKVDTLNQLSHLKLNRDTVETMLAGATALSPQKTPEWMGAYVVSYIYQQKIYKIDISTYSGFFYDESSQSFFEVAPEKQQSWHDYLSKNMNALLSSE